MGTPKPAPEEEDKDINLKYKQGKPEPEIPEEIKLKPFPKEKPIDDKKPVDDNLGSPKPDDYPKEDEKIKPKHYKYKPGKKTKSKKNDLPDDEPIVSDVDDGFPKDKFIKKVKPELEEMKTVEMKPTKIQPVDIENKPLFATIKLKKGTPKPKIESEHTVVPKVLLKSNLQKIEYDTHEHVPTISVLEPVYVDNGVLSRNYAEAMKIKKRKPKKFEPSDLEPVELEKFEPSDFQYDKKEVPETKPSLRKETPDKKIPEEEVPKKLVIGKGKLPIDDDNQEKVTLKKIPQKSGDKLEELPKKIDKPKLKPEPEIKPLEEENFTLKPVKPLPTGESPDDIEQELLPKECMPEEQLPVEKTKYKRKKPKKDEEPSPEKKLVMGTPKPAPEEEDKDINLKYKQGKPEPEIPEEIKLKPFPREKPIDEIKSENDNLGKPLPFVSELPKVDIKTKTKKVPLPKTVGVDTPLQDLEIVSIKRTKDIPESKAIEDEFVAPFFIEKVQPLVAEHEKPTAFSCSVGGFPTPEVKWYRDDRELQTSDVYEIIVYENTSTLRISKPTEEQAGVYVCQATNAAGISTCTALLVVLGRMRVLVTSMSGLTIFV
jgi:hypothetical protein